MRQMVELYEQREPIDLLSLSNRLEEKGQLEKVGGSSYLTSLVNSVPSSSNITHYAKVVQKKSTLRKLINTANEIVELGYKESEDVEKILDEAEQKLFGVSQNILNKILFQSNRFWKPLLTVLMNCIKVIINYAVFRRGFPDLE